MIKFLKCFAVVLFLSLKSFALNVSPIEIFIDSKDKNLTGTIKLQNKTENDIPVELKIFKRQHINDKEIRSESKDFLIYPPQMILKSGESQSVRLVWLGENQKNKNPKEEIAYRLLVKQVPLDTSSALKTKKPQSSLKIIYEYVASVYIQPKVLNSKIDLELLSYDEKQKKIVANIKNIGNIHQLLNHFEYFAKVEGAKTLVRLAPEKKLETTNLLANEQRQFIFPGVKELEGKKFTLISKYRFKEGH